MKNKPAAGILGNQIGGVGALTNENIRDHNVFCTGSAITGNGKKAF